MKRSFYQVLGVEPDADREQLDAAYARATRALEAGKHRRGTVESAIEWNLLQDGYQILSHPVRRARYDAKLAAEKSSLSGVFLPEATRASNKLRTHISVFALITAIVCATMYPHLVEKMDELQISHQQAVTRKKEEQTRPVVVDPTRSAQSPSSNIRGKDLVR